jgi:hypothetical protein
MDCSLQVAQHDRLTCLARVVTGEQFVDGDQAATLNAVEDERGQARYPDDVPPVITMDDGQVLTTDLLSCDLLVCPLGDGQQLAQALGPGGRRRRARDVRRGDRPNGAAPRSVPLLRGLAASRDGGPLPQD